MKTLIEANFLSVGQTLFDKNKNEICIVTQDGNVKDNEETLSIHKMSAKYLKKINNNGWDYFYLFRDGNFITLDSLRYEYTNQSGKPHE